MASSPPSPPSEKDAAIEQHEKTTETVDDVALSKEWAHHDGKQGADQEHKMTLREGIKAYPGAIMWSVLLSTAIIMEGETALPWEISPSAWSYGL